MKASFFLPVVFTAVFAILTCIGAGTCMLYYDCTSLVAGVESSFFSVPLLLHGIILSAPFAAVAACLAMIFYLVRHPANTVLSTLIYVVCCACVWILVIPVCAKADSRFSLAGQTAPGTDTVSSGYFRKADGSIFYYAGTSADGALYGVSCNFSENVTDLDPSDAGMQPAAGVCNDIGAVVLSDPWPYADSLIKDSVRVSRPFGFLMRCLQLSRIMARSAVEAGAVSYLKFISIGLAFCALIGLKRSTSWRLINVSLIFIFFILVWVGNVYICFSETGSVLSAFFVKWFGRFFRQPFGMSFLLNSVFTVVCTAIGIVNVCRRPDPNHWSVE